MSTIQETIATLKDYNKWRRGDETITMPDPFEVGVAIGDAVRLLSELEIIKSEFEKVSLLCAQKADSNVELRMRAEKAEAENNKLLEHGIQALMIARSWVMIWGDKLSPESVALFIKHEKEFLSAKEDGK